MSFEERIEIIFQSFLNNPKINKNRLEKNKDIILKLITPLKNKKFSSSLLKDVTIRNFLCQLLVNTIIDVADIYYLNGFIINLSDYQINIKYLEENFTLIAYAMNNCEHNVNLIINRY